MNQQVEAWFEKAYIKGVTHKLQSRGYLLKGTTREPDRVKARDLVWRVAGRGEAEEMSNTVEKAKVMNAGRDTVEGSLKDYQAAEWIRHPDINKMSENEQEVVQQTAARALGRKFDRLHFDEFDGLGAGIATIGDGTAKITLPDVLDAIDLLVGEGIDDTDMIFCPLPSVFMSQLELWKQFSSADYAGPDYPLAKARRARTWRQVHFFIAPNELFTFDTGTGKDAWRTAGWAQTYLWVKTAVGAGTNYEVQSRITWENQYTAYFCNNWMPGLVKTILPEGIKRLKFKFEKARIEDVLEAPAYVAP